MLLNVVGELTAVATTMATTMAVVIILLILIIHRNFKLQEHRQMIKLTRLNGEIIYLNYLQMQYMESIPETKIKMVNGDYYLVKDPVESVVQKVTEFIHRSVTFEQERK